jgi:hypothetical protein
MGRELPLGVASRSQDRDGRPFAGRAVKLGSRERAAERAGDHRLVHVRPHGADLGKRVGSRNADQTKVFTLATLLAVHCPSYGRQCTTIYLLHLAANAATERVGDLKILRIAPRNNGGGRTSCRCVIELYPGDILTDPALGDCIAVDAPRPGRSPAEDRQISIASGNRHDTRIAHLIKQQTTSAGSPCEMYRRDYRASTHREGRRRGCRASGPTSEGAGQLPDNCLAVAGRNRQSELL